MTKDRKVEARQGPGISPGWALLLGAASVVMGVVLSGFPFVGLGLGIAGLILAVRARKLIQGGAASANMVVSKAASAAFVTSLVGTILCSVYVLLYYVLIWFTNGSMEQVLEAVGIA